MKKHIAFVLALACILGLFGCSSDKVDQTKPIFNIEHISHITFVAHTNIDVEYEVPSQYLEDISTWLGSYRLDEAVSEKGLKPGSDSISVRIEYTDGTIVENSLSTATVDGTVYYMTSDDAPDCYNEIFSGK